MPRLRTEPLEFLTTAPKRWVFEAIVNASQPDVFAAISADPSTWTWFPGFTSGGYDGAPGLGAKRWVRVGGVRYDETIVAWEEPSRWTYRVDRSSVPMAKALIEDWTFTPEGDATRVVWTFAVDPGAFFAISGPFAPKVMGALFKRAMHNLERTLIAG